MAKKSKKVKEVVVSEEHPQKESHLIEEVVAAEATPASDVSADEGLLSEEDLRALDLLPDEESSEETVKTTEEVAEESETLEASEETSEEVLSSDSEEGEVAAEATEGESVEANAEDTEADEEEKLKITDLGEIEQVVEALIFAAPKAMSHQRLRAILAANNYDTTCLGDVLKSIEHAFGERGFNLVKVAGGYQFRSHPKHSDVLEKLVEDKPQRLGTSALEVLAIVAYKQPVTRAEIDAVRGVDSGHLLRGLLEKNLVRTEGHAETTGRPLLYGTTPYFLEIFSLNSLDDLPALEEFQRELIEQAEGAAEGENGEAASLLAADPGFMGDNSGLAANPDRGDFDAPAEERFETPDFNLAENTAAEDAEASEEEEEHHGPTAEA